MPLRLILLFLLTTVCSCRGSFEENQVSEQERMVNKIFERSTRRMKKEIGLLPRGAIGRMNYYIDVLGLVCYCPKPVDLVEGRKLLVKAVNIMLDEINREEKIQPFLCRSPFLPKDIEMQIFIRTPKNEYVPEGELHFLGASQGSFTFDIHHPKRGGFFTIYKEGFDDALARIADPSLPLVAFEPEPLDTKPQEHHPSRYHMSIKDRTDGSQWYFENGTWVLAPKSTSLEK